VYGLIGRLGWFLLVPGAVALVAFTVSPPQPVHAAGNIKLPLISGVQYTVTQGNNTQDTHQGLHAWAVDFGMAEGTPIYASRIGRVAMVKADSNLGGCSSTYNPYMNYIVLDHQDGTASTYWHLRYLGSVVSVGQFVQHGQHIGYSGNTGFSCGPHLHFQIEQYAPGQFATQ
jgi:murein DD-endopeptidase MepM/ murein hydrolase activator NlpD